MKGRGTQYKTSSLTALNWKNLVRGRKVGVRIVGYRLRFEPATYEIQTDSLPLTGPFGINM
jgi:hypothetical protein